MNGGMPSPEALGGMINMLMSNPQLLQNIKNALGEAGGSNETEDADENAESVRETEKSTEAGTSPMGQELMNKLPQIMSALGGDNKSKSEREREALLCALKPYLSAERAEKVDKLINLMRIGDIISGI